MQTTIVPHKSLKKALRTQMRVIGALVLRETRTRYGKIRIGYAWAIISPILQVAVLTAVFTLMERAARVGDSIPLFFATGILSFIVFRRISSQCAGALESGRSLLAFPIVKPIDLLLSRAIAEFLTAVACLIIVLSGLVIFFDEPPPKSVEWIMVGIFCLGGIGFGYGAITAVVNDWVPAWRSIESFLTRPLIIVSGAMMPPDRFPPWLLEYISWNPMLHGVELVRNGYYWSYPSLVLDVEYLLKSTLVIVFLGLVAERANRFRPLSDD